MGALQLDLFDGAPLGVSPLAPSMLARLMRDPLAAAAHNPAARGYVVAYRGATTRCPACDGTNWLVGRQLAECGRCATALPIAGCE